MVNGPQGRAGILPGGAAPAQLVLIRHAEIECGSGDLPLLCGTHDAPLSARGREQVVCLRERLAADRACAAYSSPLRRGMETALAAPARLVAGIRLLNSLAEIHCGRVEGLPIRRIQTEYPDLWSRNEAHATRILPGREENRTGASAAACFVPSGVSRRGTRASGCSSSHTPAW